MRLARQFWSILSPRQRRGALVQLALMLTSMALETLSIGLVVPALPILAQADIASRYPAVLPLLDFLGHPTREQLVVIVMIALVSVYALKSGVLGVIAWWQSRFIFGLQQDISQRLFVGYLRQPWTFHLRRNSSELIFNAVGQVDYFTNVIQQTLIVGIELLAIVGIAAILLVVEPVGAVLVVCTLGTAGWVFSKATRGYIVRSGKEFALHEAARIQHLQQGLGGAKDVKLLGREQDFVASYRRHNAGRARVGQRHYTVLAMPRLWLELLAICGLAALVIIMVKQHKLDGLVPTVAVFAAAAFRMMPSVNRVLTAVQGVRYSLPAVDAIHRELHQIEGAAPAPARAVTAGVLQDAIALEGITFSYEGLTTPVLHDVTLTIPRGATVGLVGGSGAGKSTLVDILLGLLMPARGRVAVDGADIQHNLRGWQDQIGYVPQTIFLTDDTIRRNVAFGIADEDIDEGALWRSLRAAQLDVFVSELPEQLNTVVGERGIRLSGGQRQRIGIARALYHDPGVLVLDEATSSLDVETERGFMAAVQALQGAKTIVIVAHRFSTVAICDRLWRLERGAIVDEGETRDVLSRVPAGAEWSAETSLFPVAGV